METNPCCEGTAPQSGSEFDLTAFLLGFHAKQCSHCITQNQVVQYLSCMVGFVGEELPEMAQTLHRGGNHMNHPTRLGTDLPTQIAKRGKIISPGPAIPMRVSCWWLLGQSIHHRSLQWNHQHGWGLGIPTIKKP